MSEHLSEPYMRNRIARLEVDLGHARARVRQLGVELTRVTDSNEQLRDANHALLARIEARGSTRTGEPR